MHDRLIELCERDERHVEFLFEAVATLPAAANFLTAPRLELPYIGGLTFIAGHEPPELRHQVFRAPCAREEFRQQALDWAPSLPLRWKACEDPKNGDDVRMSLAGPFGRSSDCADWDDRHPVFHTHASGLIAYGHIPNQICNDRELSREFPPRALAGPCDGWMSWRSPEMLAQDQHMRAMCAATEAREA